MNGLMIKKLKNKSGAALVYIVVTFMVITIFSVLVVGVVYGNLNQAKAQEYELQAYYLSLSGADLCLAALRKQGTAGPNDTLLYAKYRPEVITPETLTDTLALEGGTVNLTVSAIVRDGVRWIKIVSAATLNNSSLSRETTLEFLYSNPLVQKKY